MRGDKRRNLWSQFYRDAVVVLVPVEVVPVLAIKVRQRDFHFVTGHHHSHGIVMVPINAAMAFLVARCRATIPKALPNRPTLCRLCHTLCRERLRLQEGAGIPVGGVVILEPDRIHNAGRCPDLIRPADSSHLALYLGGIVVCKRFYPPCQISFHGAPPAWR